MKTNKFDLLFESIMKSVVSESELSKPFTCEVCEKQISNSGDYDFHFETFTDEPASYNHVCYDCMEKLYDEYKDEIESGDFELTEGTNKFYMWKKCDSCGNLMEDSELKETDAGKICGSCIDGAISHGEHVSINY